MANRYAVATGNWSNTATWDGGTLPQSGDDVFADGKTVAIDQNVSVLSIRTTQRSGGTAGGGFTLNSGVTITATIIAGTTACITRAAGAAESFIVGNVSGSDTVGVAGYVHSQSNTTTITGNVSAGNTTNSKGGTITSGTVNIIGNITGGGSSGNLAYGVDLGSANLTVTGNIVAGASVNAPGVYTYGAGIITLSGNLVPNTAPAIATPNTMDARSLNHTGNILSSVDAAAPIGYIRYRLHATNTLQHSYRINNAGATGAERSLYTGGVNLNQPAATNVRTGTVYGAANEFTGTCAVPPAGSVALGVPVDNTTGTGLINQTVLQSALEAALAPNAANIVERSTNDTKAITFSWPVNGATITGQKSIDNGAYSAVTGAITFLRTESNRHYYALAYNAADRNTVESSIRYKMTDGTYTKYFNLHVVPSGDVNVTVSPLTAEQEPRNTRSRIIVYTGEGGTQYFYAIDSAGNSLNLTGFNLELRFAKGKSVIYTARTSDGSLTVSNNNQVTFTRSAALTRGDGELTYALRNMGAGEEVLLDGPVTVRYAP